MRINRRTRGEIVFQIIGLVIALLGLAYTGVKDYQKGDIKFPPIQHKEVLTKPIYPIQYCLMAHDPNINKVFYLHENGQWYDFAPEIRKYQDQGQAAVGTANGASGTSGYNYGQSAQATTNTTRH